MSNANMKSNWWHCLEPGPQGHQQVWGLAGGLTCTRALLSVKPTMLMHPTTSDNLGQSGLDVKLKERPGLWGQSFHVRGLRLKINCFEFQFPRTAVKNNSGECVHSIAHSQRPACQENPEGLLCCLSTPPHPTWETEIKVRLWQENYHCKVQLKIRECCPLLGNPSERALLTHDVRLSTNR